MHRLLSILLTLLCLAITAGAQQREANYIYVFDCTCSMTGHNGAPDVMNAAKLFLWSDIDSHDPEATVQVLLFQATAKKPMVYRSKNFSRKAVDNAINKLSQEVTNTDICNAWLAAERCIDPEKENYILLMTDGADNVQGPDSLAALLSRFCGRYPHTHARYALLTAAALEGLEPVIRVIDECDDIELVDLRKDMELNDKELTLTTGQLPYSVHGNFSALKTLKAHIECDDPYFNVSIVDNKVEDGRYTMHIKSAKGHNAIRLNDELGHKDYHFRVKMVLDEQNWNITNPYTDITIQCCPERLATLEAFAAGNKIEMPEVTWHQGFLFWPDEPMDTMYIDIAPRLNENAVKAGTKVNLLVKERNQTADCRLLIDDREDSIMALYPTFCNKRVGIVFARNAKEGTRHIDVTVISSNNLDRINGQQPDEATFTVTTSYHVVWHPAKWITVILLTITIAGLLVWFLVLKPIIYPTIKTGKIIVGDPYYASYRVRGAREAVLCSAPIKQGFINRLFTGRIVSCVGPTWTHPIVCTRGRGGLHLRLGSAYTIDPYSNKLQPGVEYQVENLETKEKVTIQAI